MFLAGVPVHSKVVRGVAGQLRDSDLAHRLETAVQRDAVAVRLSDNERSVILKALEDAPPAFEDIRSRLLEEHAACLRREPLAAEDAA